MPMSDAILQTITNVISETEPLLDKIDELPYDAAVALYDKLGTTAKTATANIRSIDPELRTKICAHQDALLERIIDLQTPENTIYRGESLNIYTPAIQGHRRWSNTELMKDKGLTGYLLAKAIGTQSTMYFCTKPEDYPYLSDLQDLDALYHDSPSGTEEAYYEHLNSEYEKMDVLILHGVYNDTMFFLDAYRKLRPDGIVYCGLDMNHLYMGQIPWEHHLVQRFAKQCDIVATSCTSLRDTLNRNPNVAFPCRWMTNGFFNPTNTTIKADPSYKKNVILTIGRIGDMQKNNGELLNAFATISHRLKDWVLRLVGPIEPGFQPFIDDYFANRPDLKERVIFTGPIVNKEEIYDEYARAKIFALSSIYEGFPNVYAEALYHGCMFVTSNIDAADDITHRETLGITYKLGDVDALATALVTLSHRSDKSAMKKHINKKCISYAQKYFDAERNAKKLAYMLFSGDPQPPQIP